MTVCSSQASWQLALKSAITDPAKLLNQLALPRSLLPMAEKACELFPLRVPSGFVARMKKGDLHDPLLKQVLPLGLELEEQETFSADPLQEKQANPVNGLLHKYQGRVLLTLTGTCAIQCRYCFRRHFPYEQNNPGRSGWQTVFEYIQSDPSIREVILSGGDPLLATDLHLKYVIEHVSRIAHVKTLRIHTRLPIVLPERITMDLLQLFQQSRLKIVCVVHCNHAQEIDSSVITALQALKKYHVILLNQTVLLKGINDTAEALIELSQTLFEHSVLPYYLHQCDRVRGAHHFYVNENKGKSLIKLCQAKLPGYLVPRYVVEKPGEMSKVLL